jgi:hypothetical protein
MTKKTHPKQSSSTKNPTSQEVGFLVEKRVFLWHDTIHL